jgi:hypothetical protein
MPPKRRFLTSGAGSAVRPVGQACRRSAQLGGPPGGRADNPAIALDRLTTNPEQAWRPCGGGSGGDGGDPCYVVSRHRVTGRDTPQHASEPTRCWKRLDTLFGTGPWGSKRSGASQDVFRSECLTSPDDLPEIGRLASQRATTCVRNSYRTTCTLSPPERK